MILIFTFFLPKDYMYGPNILIGFCEVTFIPNTVKPVLNGHPLGMANWPLYRLTV